MDYNKLANLLYPNITKTIQDYMQIYPKRKLPDGAMVMRFAPSPTGFFHIGGLYSSLISRLTTKKTDGIFYLRLEDTDQKREIPEAGNLLFNGLKFFGIEPDEGYRGNNCKEIGNYGPYIQSNRLEIYHAFAKELVRTGKAFACFCEKTESKEDVLEKRQELLEQEETLDTKDVCRNLSYEEIEENIKNKKPFAIRLKSEGNKEKTFEFDDLIKGKRQVRENTNDIVLVKSNGIPPYSLAHVVDDTLMGTTVVLRGEEWYASLASHLEIFSAFGFTPPRYAHSPVLCKLDDTSGNKRKLSKRKDPESSVNFYIENGYPKEAVLEYLINLINSDFEIWRAKNPTKHYSEFDFSISKMGSNNSMFDIVKLNDISKNYISKLSAVQVYESLKDYAKIYDKPFYQYITQNMPYVVSVLNIDRDTPKPRKDIACFCEIKNYFSYMFDVFNPKTLADYEIGGINVLNIKNVIKEYLLVYNENDDKQTWFDNIKQMSEKLGYASDNKLYKQNPDMYKGNIADVCLYIRLAITGKKNSPDLYSILCLLKKQKVNLMLNRLISIL